MVARTECYDASVCESHGRRAERPKGTGSKFGTGMDLKGKGHRMKGTGLVTFLL